MDILLLLFFLINDKPSIFAPKSWCPFKILTKNACGFSVTGLLVSRDPGPSKDFWLTIPLQDKTKAGILSLYVVFLDLMMGEDLTNLLAEAPTWNLREGKKGKLSVFVERPTNLNTD
jgi:hypothetical protein